MVCESVLSPLVSSYVWVSIWWIIFKDSLFSFFQIKELKSTPSMNVNNLVCCVLIVVYFKSKDSDILWFSPFWVFLFFLVSRTKQTQRALEGSSNWIYTADGQSKGIVNILCGMNTCTLPSTNRPNRLFASRKTVTLTFSCNKRLNWSSLLGVLFVCESCKPGLVS